MDPTFKIALVAGASAIIGGLVTGVIAPHVAWGIEKRRDRTANRRILLSSARKMIAEVAKQRGTAGTLMELLERREEFHGVKRYLSNEVIGELHRPHTAIVGSTIDAGLSYLSDELAKLEQKWKLL
jgi:hypothetical protein